MNRLIRLIVGGLAAGAGLLAAAPANAQIMCNDATLPNPMIVTGSSAFEATLKQLAVKLSADTAFPSTVIYVSATGQTASCAGVANAAGAVDLGGLAGRYYTLERHDHQQQQLHLRGRPEAARRHLRRLLRGLRECDAAEAGRHRGHRGAGASDAVHRPEGEHRHAVHHVQGSADDVRVRRVERTDDRGLLRSAGIFCRVPDSGTQITVARNIGLPETVLISSQCVPGSGTSNVIAGVMGFPTASQAIGFIAADAFDANRTTFNSLAFQASGETQAYSRRFGAGRCDRKNVRDGHYTIWGYEHFIVKRRAAR